MTRETVRILSRQLAADSVKAFAATLAAICSIYLVVDYIDRARMYNGEGWIYAVAVLYAHKAVAIAYQLAPGAMLLAAGITIASLRKRGEYTAMRALAMGPLRVALPLVVASAVGVGLVVLADEWLVGRSSRRIDEITAGRFKHYGDWRFFFGENRWFRGKRHIYQLRYGSPNEGFSNVTIYTLSDQFRLARRLDAKLMAPVGGGRWKLFEGSQRDLSGLESHLERFDEREMVFEEDPSSFNISKGRPEQLSLRELRDQIRLRQAVGLPSQRYVLALHGKLAYPMGGLPGVLLACGLVMRRGRRSYLTSAIAEGFLLMVLMWALLVVFKATAMAGLLAPAAAAWAPVVLFGALSLVAFRVLAR